MKTKTSIFLLFLLFMGKFGYAQVVSSKAEGGQDCNRIFVSTTQTASHSGKAYPTRIDAFVCFESGKDRFLLDALYTLDSVYKIAFNRDNNRFYKVTIIGYDDGEPLTEGSSGLARKRAISVFNYFSSREETEYIIKTTPSSYFHSCKGNVDYFIRYKVPFDFKWINLFKKSEEERSFMKTSLVGKCHIIVEEDSEACLGDFFDYYFPRRDTTLLANGAKVKIHKGSLLQILHTKDTIPYDCQISYASALSFEQIMTNYQLVPHPKYRIINCGYVVINSNQTPDWTTCKNKENYKDSIFITVPLQPHQEKSGLKFFAKQVNSKGRVEYKMISTKKYVDRETKEAFLQGQINALQCDTIYIGKKVIPKELGNYFFAAKQGEPGAFSLEGMWIKPYRMNRRGEMEIKKDMTPLLPQATESQSDNSRKMFDIHEGLSF